MDTDPAVVRLLDANGITAVPDETGKLVYLTHRPSGITLERAVFPDLLNIGHAVDALLAVAG